MKAIMTNQGTALLDAQYDKAVKDHERFSQEAHRLRRELEEALDSGRGDLTDLNRRLFSAEAARDYAYRRLI